MIGFLILLAAVLNAVYLISFYQLMSALQKHAPAYWDEIGRPRSFSGKDVSSMLNNLYTSRLKTTVGEVAKGLVTTVRVLLPLTFVISGLTICLVAMALESAN